MARKIVFLSLLILFLLTSNVFAWWSWSTPGGSQSTHNIIGDAVYNSVSSQLTNEFLETNWNLINGYTYTPDYDTNAHGGYPARNGGDIPTLFKDFLNEYQKYQRGESNIAAEKLGYCIHLIEDMNVPAHAFNIPHYDPNHIVYDNFERVADEYLIIHDLSTQTISGTSNSSDPATYFYNQAKQQTIDNVIVFDFSNYWQNNGTGQPWCGGLVLGCSDGAAGFYSSNNTDIFSISIVVASSNEKNFIKNQLNQAVKYTGRFLLTLDKYLSVSPSVTQPNLSGPPGTTFSQSGSGFFPNSTATLHFRKPDGTEFPTQIVNTDSSGNFSISYTAPLNKEVGTYTWWAIDNTTGKRSNDVSYTITVPPFNPYIEQSMTKVPHGATIKQWGTGLTPDSNVILHFRKPDGTEYPTLTLSTNSAGYFETPYTVPMDKPLGVYTWWAVDDTRNVSSNQGSYEVTSAGDIYISSHTVYGNETWYSGWTYVVQGSITVANEATLTIEPGSIIKLTSGAPITVYGTLNASGVKFTWADGVNPWQGIYFEGMGSTNSRIENSVIEHVRGNYCGWSDCYSPKAISIKNSSPTITGNTLNNSASSYGIWVDNGSPVISNNTVNGFGNSGIYVYNNSSPTVTGNTITNNVYGICVDGSSGGTYTGNTISGNINYGIYTSGGGTYTGNTFSGNGYGIFTYYDRNPLISGNTYSNNTTADLYVLGTINTNIYWNEPGTIVYRTDGLTIAEGASLTIVSGRTVKLRQGARITAYGTLTATGVTFTSVAGQGQWDGIWFDGAGSSGSRIENCTIEHAGYGSCGWSDCWYNYRAIDIKNSSPTITGCTINNSDAWYGIKIENGSPVISNNTISGMTMTWGSQGYGIYVTI
ncbi:MAG: right-handed parallel beta-helix repeat-containing protein [Nitrospirae bacterium]|nr:right-handed parallel beta-helix repeat-containing protein [Nitrospirota bacterium]